MVWRSCFSRESGGGTLRNDGVGAKAHPRPIVQNLAKMDQSPQPCGVAKIAQRTIAAIDDLKAYELLD
jgi:hypothetical protein